MRVFRATCGRIVSIGVSAPRQVPRRVRPRRPDDHGRVCRVYSAARRQGLSQLQRLVGRPMHERKVRVEASSRLVKFLLRSAPSAAKLWRDDYLISVHDLHRATDGPQIVIVLL